MIRLLILILTLSVLPHMAHAFEGPKGQARLDQQAVLRGHFTEEHMGTDDSPPLRSSGHFVAAPAYGLIWGIETPFPTSTIVTRNGAVQDIGGIAVKLPIHDLLHLYTTVSHAMAGDWDALAADFVITQSGDAKHWHLMMTPRPSGTHKQPYTAIAISGGRFVENVAMTKSDGGSDTVSFSDATLSSTPPTAREIAAFSEVAP